MPSLGSGTVLWHQCRMGSDRRKSKRKWVLLGGCRGAEGWKAMEDTQCWQIFKLLFIAVLHRNKKDQYLLVAESIILHEKHRSACQP